MALFGITWIMYRVVEAESKEEALEQAKALELEAQDILDDTYLVEDLEE